MTLKNTAADAKHQRDVYFMKKAIQLAKRGESLGEVPVGAIVVDKAGKILARATNLREQKKTVLGHAELVAVHRACQKHKSWRLTDCTLYVTLEPCFMCAGALVQSRLSRVVFGARDPKGGALGSLIDLSKHKKLNHHFEVEAGICQQECSELLTTFFKKKRASSNS